MTTSGPRKATQAAEAEPTAATEQGGSTSDPREDDPREARPPGAAEAEVTTAEDSTADAEPGEGAGDGRDDSAPAPEERSEPVDAEGGEGDEETTGAPSPTEPSAGEASDGDPDAGAEEAPGEAEEARQDGDAEPGETLPNGEIDEEDAFRESVRSDRDRSPDSDHPDLRQPRAPAEIDREGEYPGSSTRLDAQQQSGRDSYLAGRDINNVYDTLAKPRFEQLARSSLERLRDVFVEPVGFPEQPGLGQRVFLVHGGDHAGKWTCAVNLAGRLRQVGLQASTEARTLYYCHSTELPLAETLGTDDLPAGGVILFKDCFQRNVRLEDLERSMVGDLLSRLLEKKDCVLILTGILPAEPPEDLAAVQIEARYESLRDVLEKHLTYSVRHQELFLEVDPGELVDLYWDVLKPHLDKPVQILQFCERLLDHGIEGVKTKERGDFLVGLAREVASRGSQMARRWFRRLDPHEMLFSMLVHLFEEGEPAWVEGIYRAQVRRFRDGGFLWFRDTREQGMEDLKANARVNDSLGVLEFDEVLYQREVGRQVGSRQELLWEVLDSLVASLEGPQWGPPWRRRSLGVALGRLGAHDKARLFKTLTHLGKQDHWPRAVIPGYALQELVQTEAGDHFDFVEFVLHVWTDSRNHCLMWSAAAAAWRVHHGLQSCPNRELAQSFKDRVFRLLRKLAMKLASFDLPQGEDDDGKKAGERKRPLWLKNFFGIVGAMSRIGLIDPPAVAPELGRWVEHDSGVLKDLGRKSLRSMFTTFSQLQLRPPAPHRDPLLDLLHPLLDRASDRSLDVQAAFLTLRAWLRDEALVPWVRRRLLDLATRCPSKVRHRLRRVLSRFWLDPRPDGVVGVACDLHGGQPESREGWHSVAVMVEFWCDGTEVESARVSSAVIARCLAMEGALPALPPMGPAVAVVDPGLLRAKAGSEEPSSPAVWALLGLLDSRFDLRLQWLGEAGPADLLSAGRSALELLPKFPGHRLTVPGLDASLPADPCDVFLLAPSPPHDTADLLTRPGLRTLYHLGPDPGDLEGEEGKAPGNVRFVDVELPWPPSTHELEGVVEGLEERWARDLALAGPERWLGLVSSLGIEEPDADTCWGRLAELASALRPPAAPAAGRAGEPEAAADGDGPPPEPPNDGEPWKQDPVARAIILFLWLAASDLTTCLEGMARWLTDPASGDAGGTDLGITDAEERRAVATAGALALLHLYSAYPPDPWGEGRAPTALFDLLADPLARQGPDAVAALVRFLVHWVEDPAWARHLAGGVRDGRGRLERWSADHLVDHPSIAEHLAARLEAARPPEGVGAGWVALASLHRRLQALRALEHPKAVPPLADGEDHVLVVVDRARGEKPRQRGWAELGLGFFARLAAADGVVPLLYRLGERRPFWAEREELPAPGRLLPFPFDPPPLIGPLLRSMEPRRDRVAAILLVADRLPADVADWAPSHWWSKIAVYGATAPSREASFSALPAPLDFTLSPLVETRMDLQVRRVLDHLTLPSPALPGDGDTPLPEEAKGD